MSNPLPASGLFFQSLLSHLDPSSSLNFSIPANPFIDETGEDLFLRCHLSIFFFFSSRSLFFYEFLIVFGLMILWWPPVRINSCCTQARIRTTWLSYATISCLAGFCNKLGLQLFQAQCCTQRGGGGGRGSENRSISISVRMPWSHVCPETCAGRLIDTGIITTLIFLKRCPAKCLICNKTGLVLFPTTSRNFFSALLH